MSVKDSFLSKIYFAQQTTNMAEDETLQQLIQELTESGKTSLRIKREICLYICVRMLAEKANFDDQKSARTAFMLHYGELLIDYYRQEKYPNSTSFDKGKRDYCITLISKEIWSTIWAIHSSQQVSEI